ncbi:microtubule-associated protein tau-like [Dysidea avara]|uniref:microtubule-associated protein tau-like n=1 Tax=Dysidea avara TaxID=196820 RepID=UPI003317DAA1
MDDTDDQEEDASMEKMADSLSNAATLHGSTKDVDEDSKSGDDFSKETSAADSDTRHSFSLNIPRDIHYPGGSERLRMRSLPFFYVPDGKYKRKISQAQSKVGSLDNILHSPGGGKKKIFSQKVDVSSAKSNIVVKRQSLPEMRAVRHLRKEEDNTTSKSATEIHSKVGSLDNISRKPQGGNKKILTYPIPNYKCKVSSKVDSSDPTSRMHQLGDADLFFCSEVSQLHPRFRDDRPHSAPGPQRISNERSTHTLPCSSPSKSFDPNHTSRS